MVKMVKCCLLLLMEMSAWMDKVMAKKKWLKVMVKNMYVSDD